MTKRPILLPSLLSAPFDRLGETIRSMEQAGAHVFHYDVMDGHFVPNITIGPLIIDSLGDSVNCEFDAHLMVTNPSTQMKWFNKPRVRSVTLHVETSSGDMKKDLQWLKDHGKRAGAAISPPTTLAKLEPILPIVDQVLVMTVYPGFAGQAFLKETLPKIEELAAIRERSGYDFTIQVDGGINRETLRFVHDAGAEEIVSGAAIFDGGDPAGEFIRLNEMMNSWREDHASARSK
ncbi:MAG: ribulose-phosphate 3-epimerase [bacterium]|nr:ribulose-phosphate 3-epimerase [bacterium]